MAKNRPAVKFGPEDVEEIRRLLEFEEDAAAIGARPATDDEMASMEESGAIADLLSSIFPTAFSSPVGSNSMVGPSVYGPGDILNELTGTEAGSDVDMAAAGPGAILALLAAIAGRRISPRQLLQKGRMSTARGALEAGKAATGKAARAGKAASKQSSLVKKILGVGLAGYAGSEAIDMGRDALERKLEIDPASVSRKEAAAAAELENQQLQAATEAKERSLPFYREQEKLNKMWALLADEMASTRQMATDRHRAGLEMVGKMMDAPRFVQNNTTSILQAAGALIPPSGPTMAERMAVDPMAAATGGR